jgi:predicted transposase YdaD
MSREKTRDRVRLRLSMLERVVGSKLDQAVKYLLVNVIETFFVLSGEDAERYRRLVSRKEYRAVQEVELTWADRLMEKGREEGREAGVVEGMRRSLLRQLTAKFGDLPKAVAARIESMSVAELDSILERILTATALDELGLGV